MAKISAQISNETPKLPSVVALLWRTFCRDITDPYRPELHYMRGPGPKWRAKHGVTSAPETPDLVHNAAVAA
jgi:hypothetical protein